MYFCSADCKLPLSVTSRTEDNEIMNISEGTVSQNSKIIINFAIKQQHDAHTIHIDIKPA